MDAMVSLFRHLMYVAVGADWFIVLNIVISIFVAIRVDQARGAPFMFLLISLDFSLCLCSTWSS